MFFFRKYAQDFLQIGASMEALKQQLGAVEQRFCSLEDRVVFIERCLGGSIQTGSSPPDQPFAALDVILEQRISAVESRLVIAIQATGSQVQSLPVDPVTPGTGRSD